MMFNQPFSHCSHYILYHIPQLVSMVVFLKFFSVLNILTRLATMLPVGSL